MGPVSAAEYQEKMQAWLADGSIRAKLHITEGIGNAAEGLTAIFWGDTFGKAVLKGEGRVIV